MQKLRDNRWVIVIILLTIAGAMLFQTYGMESYSRFNSTTLEYVKGTVTQVTAENLTYEEDLDINVGTQDLIIRLDEGEYQGEEIEVTNYVSNTHQCEVSEGMSVIINVDEPEGIEPYYTLYNYDRSIPMAFGIAVLILAIVLIAKGKGVKAILGLAYSLYLVVCVLLPMVFSGYSPIAVSILCAILSVTVTLLLLNGQSKKTYAAIVSTVAGVIVSLIFFLILSNMMHLDGFSAEESEGLILIGESTGLRVKDILFAGVLISSLGAIMDTGMSIVSSLYEVYRHNTALTSRELLRSGIEIGKDMIGTMCNTLILAFTGSSFLTLLVFLSYDVQFNQLFNSNFLSMEIAQGICGSLGIVLTVPIASLITAYVLCRSPQSPETIEEDESEEEEENDEAFLERS